MDDGKPQTVDELAAIAGVHRTVAFNHLERLADVGYVEKSQRRGRLGKPAGLYSIRVGVLSVTYPPRQFVALTGMLAAAVAGLGDQSCAAAKDAGRQFGTSMGQPGATSISHALLPLRPLGSDYAVRGNRIVAGNCVFLEACDQAREVVCAIHAGMLEGTLSQGGIEARVEPQGRVAHRGCAYRATRSG